MELLMEVWLIGLTALVLAILATFVDDPALAALHQHPASWVAHCVALYVVVIAPLPPSVTLSYATYFALLASQRVNV